MAKWHSIEGGVHVPGDHSGVISGVVANTLADAKGDMIAASAADTWAKLTVGANDLALIADSAQTLGVKWAAIILQALADAKGDLIAATAADTFARLAVGANKLALHAASAEATGLKWQVPGGKTVIAGFRRENLAATLTNSQLERSLSAVLDAALPIVATHAGSIVGISVASTEARTVGTATFEVFKNGTGTGLTCQLNGTDPQYAFAVQAIDTDAYAAGDRLDIRVTTSGDWAPTTADVEAAMTLQTDPI